MKTRQNEQFNSTGTNFNMKLSEKYGRVKSPRTGTLPNINEDTEATGGWTVERSNRQSQGDSYSKSKLRGKLTTSITLSNNQAESSNPMLASEDTTAGVHSRLSNQTFSTNDTLMASAHQSKDELSKQGTMHDLQSSTFYSELGQSGLVGAGIGSAVSSSNPKELVSSQRDQLEQTRLSYERNLDNYLNERASMENENEFLNEKIHSISHCQAEINDNIRKSHDTLNNSFAKVARMEFDQNADSERTKTKLALMEETLQRRNDKQQLVAKEQAVLSKNLDTLEKKRRDSERRVTDYGDRVKKRVEEVSLNKASNNKEQIEVLQEKINYLSNMLALSEEKKFRYEHLLKMQQSKK